MFTKIKEDLLKQQRPSKAEFHLRFFKCGKGEYGEGDQFLGVSVPDQRKIAKKYFKEVSYEDVQRLLDSKIHEHRLTGLFLLNYKFEKFPEERKKIYELYKEDFDLYDEAKKIVEKRNQEKSSIINS